MGKYGNVNDLYDVGTNPLMGFFDKYLGTHFYDNELAMVNMDYNHDEAELDRQFRERIMKWQNTYNSPAAQMERLRAAGLNPSLAQGQPVAEAAPVSGSGAPSASLRASSHQGNLVQDLLGIKLANAQVKDIEASARLKQEQATTEESMRQSRIDNLEAATANLAKQNEGIQAEIDRKLKENQLTDEQISKIRFDRMMEGKYFMLDKKKVENETSLTAAQVDKLEADRRLALAKAKVTNREYDEMVWTFAIRRLGLEKQVSLTDAQIKHADATARKLGMDADILSGTAMYESNMSYLYESGSIFASARYGIQALARDIGGLLGGLKL